MSLGGGTKLINPYGTGIEVVSGLEEVTRYREDCALPSLRTLPKSDACPTRSRPQGRVDDSPSLAV